MKHFIVLFLLAFGLSSFGQSTANFFDVDRHVIVVPADNQKFLNFIHQTEYKVIQEWDQLGWFLVDLPSGKTFSDAESEMKISESIKAIYRDEIQEYNRDYIPNDPSFSSQWFLRQTTDKDIDADLAWDSIPANNTATKVAVFDGGIDITHEDLIGNIVTPFNAVTNAYSNGELVNQYDRHGTACSGTIAAVTNNGIGISSVGNNRVKVMPINIMSNVYSGGSFNTTSGIQINALNAAIAQGCVAISMSYGGGSYSSALDAAFTQAKNTARNGKGLFICASTGNGSSGTITQYPASYSGVYGIGASTSSDLRASFSNYGTIVDISAPGSSILTTDITGSGGYSTGNYWSVSGTSFSCPITAAAGALLMYKNPDLSELAVMQILASTAEKVGGYTYSTNSLWPYSTRSNELGYGRINLAAAINSTPSTGNPPVDPPTSIHNFFVSSCSVSSNLPNVNTSITISTQQRTNTPTLASVTPTLQYRWSTDNVWSTGDQVIGTDQSTLGGGIDFESENIQFTVPSTPGTWYILIRANHDNAISEVTSVDNVCSIQVTVVNPVTGGADLRAFFLNTEIVTCGTNTGSGATVRFQNVGTSPITAFTYRWRWESCPSSTPSYYNCNNLTTTSGFLTNPINSMQYTGTYLSNWCIANCGLASSPFDIIPVGTTRNLIVEIISVNGVIGDANATNNIAIIPVTRIACTTGSADSFETEVPTIKIYTVTGMLVDETSIDRLSKGVYIIQYQYPTRVYTEKIIIP